ncbi:MAG: LamG-like jellyroll fold domain-containing protein [Ignavibacteria bacterium]
MNTFLRILVIVLLSITCMQAQIPSYVPTNGLIGWWPFNGNANDESGNGNHGIVKGGSVLNRDRSGNDISSYLINGINCPSPNGIELQSQISNANDFSISLWFRIDNKSKKYQCILNSYPHEYFGISFNYLSESSLTMFSGNGSWWSSLTDTINLSTPDNWNSLIVVKSDLKINYFINGVQKKSINIGSDYNTGSISSLIIGAISINGGENCYETFYGAVDDVAIWDRALSQVEIMSLQAVQPLYLASISIVSNVTCFDGSNGSASVAVNGGIGPYTYAWNTNPVQTTQTATNLSAGTYTVTVKDSRDSIATASITITQPPAITNVTATVIKNVDCFGEADGSASVSNPTGGTPPYSYSWNTIPAQQTQNATNMKAGDYTVTITDSKGCISQAAVTITQPNSPVEIGQAIVEQYVSCHGLSDGIINISAPFGGTAPYTIVWNTQPVRYGERLEGVEAGTYTAVVIDSKGCIAEATTTVTEPEKIRVLSPKDTIVLIQSNALFYAKSNNEGTTYQWQTNLGIGFQDIQEIYQYTGTKTPILNIANCSFYNRNQPFRCILKTNGCYDTTEIATLSIRTNVSVDDDSHNTRLSISPNPTGEADQFLVRFAEIPHHDIAIELLDILGSVHYSKTLQAGSESCTIPVQSLSSGMYMLRVRMNNEVFIEKVIVN